MAAPTVLGSHSARMIWFSDVVPQWTKRYWDDRSAIEAALQATEIAGCLY